MKKPNFFSRGSPYLSHPLLTSQRTRKEIDFILSEISLPDNVWILDIGCGFGRHSIELAGRGYRVVGIDPSETMVKAALENSTGMENAPQFVIKSAQAFRTDQLFNAALCLFTTLGQINADGDNSSLIDCAAQMLISGGFFVLEVPRLNWLVNNLKQKEIFKTPTGKTTVKRSFDADKSVVTENFSVQTGANQQEYLMRYRVYAHEELVQRINAAGFIIKRTFGGYQHEPLNANSQTLLIVAQKLL